MAFQGKRICALILALAILAACCSACAKSHGNRTESIELTDHEKELLCDIFHADLEQQQIRSGQLYASQKELLEQLRVLEQWLQGKYPSHSFDVSSIQIGHGLNNSVDFIFTADGLERSYSAKAKGIGSRDFEENFFVTVLSDRCETELSRRLLEDELPLAAMDFGFTGLAGAGVTETTTPDAMLSKTPLVGWTVSIFLTGGNDALEKAKSSITAMAMPGAYWLCASEKFQENMGIDECWKTKSENENAVRTESFRIQQADP